MTTSKLPLRKAVRPSARSPAGHGSVRSNAAFTMLQPHRSSATHRPADRKNATDLSASVSATTHPTAPLNSTVAAHGQIPIAERAAPPQSVPLPAVSSLGGFRTPAAVRGKRS